MRRFLLVLIAIFFLPLTATAQTRWQPELRVGLFSAPTVTLNFSLPIKIEGKTIDANKPVTVSIADNKIKIGDNIINGAEIELRPNDDALIREMTAIINDKKYPGTVKLILKNGKLTVINLTTTDEYLRGVVPNETRGRLRSKIISVMPPTVMIFVRQRIVRCTATWILPSSVPTMQSSQRSDMYWYSTVC